MSLKADVLIVGAGGMGALFGSILQAGGLEVVLQDTNLEHVEAIQRDGLQIKGFGGDRKVEITAISDPGQIQSADLLLFQCKHLTLCNHLTPTLPHRWGSSPEL